MVKSILKLMAGNGAAQLIQFASIPIFTRFYSPEDFGLFAIAIAISGILAVVSSLQLNVAIVSLKSRIAVERLLSSALLMNLMMLLASTVLVFLANVIFYDSEVSVSLILLIVTITFFSSINNILKGVFVYLGEFSSLSKTFVFRALTIISLQFLFVFFPIDNGLVIGLLVGEVMMFFIILFVQLRMQSKFFLLSNRTFKRLYVSLKKLKAFTLYGTAQELVSVAIFWFPLLIISTYFGSVMGGEYSISARILWPATVLVTGSVAQVLFHRIVNMSKEEIAKELFFSHYFKLLFIPLVLIAYYVTPVVFSFILDKQWMHAIELSKYVAILCVVFLYVVPYRVVFRALKLQKIQLIIESAIVLIIVITFNLIDVKSMNELMLYMISFMLVQAIVQEFIIRNIIR